MVPLFLLRLITTGESRKKQERLEGKDLGRSRRGMRAVGAIACVIFQARCGVEPCVTVGDQVAEVRRAWHGQGAMPG